MAEFASPFPESPRIAFEKNPIAQASVEIEYDIHFGLHSASPVEFRKRLEDRYPKYVETAIGIQIPASVIPNAMVEEHRPVHQFLSTDSKRVVRLSEMSLSFTLTDYVSYEQFRGYWKELIDLFTDCYGTPILNRASLRYLDVFRRSALGLDRVPWHDLVRSELLGLLNREKIELDVRQCLNHAIVQLGMDGWIATIRSGMQLALPTNEEALFLDASFAIERPIEIQNALSVCDDLKRHAGRFFRWSVLDRLRESMGPKQIPDFCPV